MGWRDLMGAPAEAEPPYTQNPHNPQNPRPPLNFGDIGDIGYMPPAPESEPVPILAAAVDNSGAVDNSEPTAHCERCGSPSWWRSPASPGWRCSWCEPRPRSRAEAVESVTLAGGQWAPDRRPPADPDDDPPDPVAPRPPRPDDGRVQDAFGAWRTPAAHAAVAAFYAHHWTCAACIRAGRGYGARCEAGARLHALTRGTEK